MRKLLGYLTEYLQAHFNLKLYVSTFIFTAVFLFLNFNYSLERSLISSYASSPFLIVVFFLENAFPYYTVCLFVYLFTDNKKFIKEWKFWAISMLGFLIIGIERGTNFAVPVTKMISSHKDTFRYTFNISQLLLNVMTFFIPLYLVYRIFNKKTLGHFYGLRLKGFDFKFYVMILCLMLPFIILISFLPEFQSFYPLYKKMGGLRFAQHLQISEWNAVILYEFVYALSFVTVELFFRGFLILGLVKYLGKDVILPMAVIYCFLHFGKPPSEAISSFFGGYILGVLALRTSNILGGIFVHVGIALFLEWFAFLQMG